MMLSNFHLHAINLFPIAKPFVEVQKQVAELLIDRVLVGHAVFNDLKVCHAQPGAVIYLVIDIFSLPGITALPPSSFDARYATMRRKG